MTAEPEVWLTSRGQGLSAAANMMYDPIAVPRTVRNPRNTSDLQNHICLLVQVSGSPAQQQEKDDSR